MVTAVEVPRSDRTERQVIAFLAFAGSLLALGIDIALPAFDEIAPSIGIEPSSNRITLIITVYFIGMAFGQLIWGPIADRFGRARTMYAGVGLYVVAAIGAALSRDLNTLLVVRLVWGFGAAAPAGLRGAIARDLYSGDQMARVMSLMMAIFMVGPIAAPLVGEAILYVFDWQAVFLFCAIAGVGQLVWTRRFGETMHPDLQRPLQFKPTFVALAHVLRTRQTLGYTVGYGLASASFFVYLSSTQPIMDRLYGRADQFALLFGVSGIVMAAAFALTNRLVVRFGAKKIALLSAAGSLFLATFSLIVVLLAGGLPTFWWWVIPVMAINLAAAPLGPVGITLALEPMGDLAGTASGVVGFLSILIGSSLAAVIDAQITVDVVPMAIGSVVFFIGCGGAVVWADRAKT